MTNYSNNQITEFILKSNHKTYSKYEVSKIKEMISQLTLTELEDILNNNSIHYQMFYVISKVMGLSFKLQNTDSGKYYLPILNNKVFKYRGKETTISRINILN